MDLWQCLMLAVALLSGVGAVWQVTGVWLLRLPELPWSATTAALSLAYFIVQAWYLTVGVVQPGDLFMVDLVTILLIYCRAIARDTECAEYESDWHQLKCFALAPTLNDRLVLGLFVLAAWPVYVLAISDFARWWALYAISMAQFLIAGEEAFREWRLAKARVTEPDTPSSGSLRAAWGTGGGG